MNKKTFLIFLSLLITFLSLAQTMHANENDLIIQDDGNILLMVTTGSVLAAETKPTKSEKIPPAPQPQTPPTGNTVPLVPAHTQSTVQIIPPINNGKQVQVTITTSPNQTSTPQPSPEVTTRAVDRVVAQSSGGTPVITIKSEKAHQLTIQQGTTSVTTALPLQIDTLSHGLSVISPNKSSHINVLPLEALQGIVAKGILTTENVDTAKINLTKDTSGVTYTVNTQKQGKLFGLPVSSPVQVKLSAQNGKIVTVGQSLLFNIFGGIIK